MPGFGWGFVVLVFCSRELPLELVRGSGEWNVRTGSRSVGPEVCGLTFNANSVRELLVAVVADERSFRHGRKQSSDVAQPTHDLSPGLQLKSSRAARLRLAHCDVQQVVDIEDLLSALRSRFAIGHCVDARQNLSLATNLVTGRHSFV